MGLTHVDHSVRVGEVKVSVEGTTGPVQPTWKLLFDDLEVDRAKASGDFSLVGDLPDGSSIQAKVHQSLLGPTEVTLVHRGQEIGHFTGFVA